MRRWHVYFGAVFLLLIALRASPRAEVESQPVEALPYADGHSRPRALLYNPQDGLLYVALSTRDQVAVIDPLPRPAQLVARIASGRFPQALSLLPSGDVLVVCRYDERLGVIRRAPHTRSAQDRYHTLPPLPVHGLRDAVVHRSGRILVSVPAHGSVQVLDPEQGVVQTVATGLGPRTLRSLRDPRSTQGDELLLISNFMDHTVDVHALQTDGRIAGRLQRIQTHAPVQDLLFVPPPLSMLLLLSHEDRAVDRSAPLVAGLDSVVLLLPAGSDLAGPPFVDAGPGLRASVNLSERRQPVVKLDGLALDPNERRLAIVGAATDNVLIANLPATRDRERSALPEDRSDRAAHLTSLLLAGATVTTGNNPVALTFVPDGRVATADRLSDSVSLIDAKGQREVIVVGTPARTSEREHGEILFFSRALVPHNVGTGERSLYACSACHDDGHVDGRLHPARQNRFRSMTKTCRSIGSTAPYLFLGEVANVPDFAANVVSTHAQGSEKGPGFDRYNTTLRLPSKNPQKTHALRLSPEKIRTAMAAYLASLPAEPSPFVPLGTTALPEPARRGLSVFKSSCAPCHRLVRDSHDPDEIPTAELERSLLRGEVALTDTRLHDVGIHVLGPGGNNAPSLRGVWDNAPYFSDGSARTLEEVLQRTHPDPKSPSVHAGSGLPEAEQAALLAFLRCL
ncbi:MAG: hypothetical protein JNJ46_27785 [Myxococcales bacterium]|nr:hypothetical protein [Myxococcales bacterium]